MSQYYSIDEILKRNAKYNVIWGERSNGKSYAILDHALDNYFKNGTQLALIRRWDEDYVGANSARTAYDSLMCNGNGENVIRKKSHGEYEGVEYYSGRFYLTAMQEDGKIKRTDKVICICFSLNSAEHYKSGSFPQIGDILFDEFIATKIYLPDEFIIFQNLLSTIIRQRDNVTIWMCGNTINRYNPYFTEMGLYKAKTMKQGEIDLYEYGESGLTVAVQFADSPAKKKKSDIYFAFDNPKLKMITEGDWQLDIYPHCPVKYYPTDIRFIYFILFDNEMLQCEIVEKNDQVFTFIHRKTTELKEPDKDIIFSLDYDYRINHRRKLNKPVRSWEKRLWMFFVEDKVFYQDNEVGEVVSNYLLACRNG